MRDCCRRSGHRTISAARANAHDDAFRLSIAAAKNAVLCFGTLHVRVEKGFDEVLFDCFSVSVRMRACYYKFYSDSDSDSVTCNSPSSSCQVIAKIWERTVVVEEVL